MTHKEEYYKIIDFRKQNILPKEQYGEYHHIVPKSICPILKDAPDNIVRLSAKEHFLAHYHLWKYYSEELKNKRWAIKMCFALFRMKQQLLKCDDIEEIAKLYEEARKNITNSEEAKRKNSQSHKGKIPWMKGKTHSEETKRKMSKNHANVKGKNNPNFGKHWSEEMKKHFSKINGKPVSQYTKDGKFIETYISIKDAFRKTNVRHIWECCKGINKFSGGYIWKYTE